MVARRVKKSVNVTKKTSVNKTRKIKHTSKTPFPIDIVYTWKGENKSKNERLSYNYELKYSLRSVFFNAPWVNKIFILMNKKAQPSWIKNNKKIIILDHNDTFPSKKYLPNFNSNAIETTIANIKGLSEHYIYFNDDIFIGRKSKYTDFFTPSGKAVIDGYIGKKTREILRDNNNNKLNIEFPPGYERVNKHVPIPQIKSLVLEFNKKYADYIEWIRMTKKRKDRGFDVCEKYNLNSPCQQVHLQIFNYIYSNNKAVLVDRNNKDDYEYLPNIDENFVEKLNEILSNKPFFFCINDVETNPEKRKKIPKIMLDFFNAYYPNKPDFEK